ncbi:ABC transporter ATP-binding protein [Comamonas testosteroni]|uniref:ABC transporter ATP-binding protein n=1 Tax=Comamonas testosteroni TaxID=285 RepID=A0A373FN12_COMTE|nr:ABC transporter ATP-binding protein [Comamonas testosteroni]RGE45307.1 ABC transporter ATP-binding protein [Comamonas testosteroni]
MNQAAATVHLQARQLSWKAAAAHIVRDVSLHVTKGELVGLLGPNGSGKSTLLRMIYRILKPASGSVSIHGNDVWQSSARDNARAMAVLAQENTSEFELRVRDVVLMGRTPHQSPFARDSEEDFRIAARALERVDAEHLAQRMFSTLSGGEKQRVLMARALAQQAPLLVLDEPTNHLDVRHQFELMNLIRSLGLTALAALHELPLAAHYCDRLYLLKDGALVAQGTPSEVLTSEIIADVYGVRALVRPSPRSGKPLIEFLPDELL